MKIGKTQVFLGRNPQREQISSHDRKLDILIHNVVQNDIAPMFGDEKLLEEFLRKIHNFKAGKLQEEILFENFIKETEELVNKFIPYIPEKLPEELMNLEGTIERIVEVYLHSYANRELMIANTKRDLSSALQE